MKPTCAQKLRPESGLFILWLVGVPVSHQVIHSQLNLIAGRDELKQENLSPTGLIAILKIFIQLHLEYRSIQVELK